ncbi:DUF4118 domain-containing protein [Allorhizobium sp. BGMRC 0089]|uniref:HWE histidine kinase domain-containing protein n=1 Tax=Allorhizobium sonneratiae TaxID=2934936 RepID=UPI0020347B22|nr:HWE histidine kinase domain-containing protein [Allorhizobium sonneratiae]MCM2291614.1 DUF4118 domain-containing protein [Allorhizobium sonneratiae]
MKQQRFYDRLPSFIAADQALSPALTALTYGVSILIFLFSLALRFWLDNYLSGTFPYVTFFPVVVVVAFVFGIPQGALVALLGGLASWYFFIPPYFSFHISLSTAIAMALYCFVVITDIGLTALMMRAYRAEKAARRTMQHLAAHQEVMAQELDHRLKNVFATINAIIGLSQRHTSDAAMLASSLRERINAMARSNLLLRGLRMGEETLLNVVVQTALEPFGVRETHRLGISGPPLPVSGQATLILSLVLHELGTNAAKYGALSVDGGRIEIVWTETKASDAENRPMLHLHWRESGGPAPSTTGKEKTGFGSTLVKRVIAAIHGEAHFTFAQSGFSADILIPMEAILPQATTDNRPLPL